MDTDAQIRQALLESMRKQGLTQIDLAKRLGVSAQAVSNIIRGDRGKIPSSLIELLSAANLELRLQPLRSIERRNVLQQTTQQLKDVLEQVCTAQALSKMDHDTTQLAQTTNQILKAVKYVYTDLRSVYPSEKYRPLGSRSETCTDSEWYSNTARQIQAAIDLLENDGEGGLLANQEVDMAATRLFSVLKSVGYKSISEAKSSAGIGQNQ